MQHRTKISGIPQSHAVARLAYSVAEAAQVSGIGRTTIYALIANGRLASVKVGGRRLVRHIDLEALLDAPVHTAEDKAA